jgi:hypothetical protein
LDNRIKTLRWEVYVPIWKNRFILQGLWMAIGIPFSVLIVIIIVLAGGDILGTDAKYALFLIVLLLVLTYLLTLFVYGGKYAPGFVVDREGITNYTQSSQAKQNKIMNTILIILGLYQGNFTAMGAGMIAQSRQVLRIKWKNVRWIRYYPREHTIMVKGGFAEKIALFCTEENYEEVANLARERIEAVQEKNGRRNAL